MKTYSIRRSKIVYEVLNTEVILIDFETGDYYNLEHVAKQVWQLIERQTPQNQIAKIISSLYKCDIENVESDIQQLIDQLHENGLIEVTDSSESSKEVLQFVPNDRPYITPTLQKYSDVQNLLLLDPIHEVTEAGWPEKLS